MNLKIFHSHKYFWIGTVFLVVIFLISQSKTQNFAELATAFEHDGTDRFLEQVKKGSGEWIENAGTPVFDNQRLAVKSPGITEESLTGVLGSHIASDGSEKWIEVGLSDFKLYAWEGNRKVFEFPISTGRPGYKTVTGEFRIWRKVRNQAYRGGSRERGDYYYLPNVPYSLFFHGAYAIHGAYWHNDFGVKNRSSGCVNLRISDAEQLYGWAGPAMSAGLGAFNSSPDNPGVRVIVHD